MRKTLVALSCALLTACGGAVAPSPGNGQDPSGGTNPGGANPSNPGVTNPGNPSQPGQPGQPNPGQPSQPSDPSSGTASVTGSVGGVPFSFSSLIAIEESDPGSNTTFVFVVMSNRAFSCAELQDASTRNETFANLNALMVGAYASGDRTLSAQTFDVGNGASTDQGLVVLDTTDAKCNPTSNEAQSGTVTFSTLTATFVSGSFNASFSSGDHVQGTFSAPICNIGSTSSTSTNAQMCLP
jgi:hypothetical protein